MLKGIRKNVIVVKPPQKSSFERVFFIMKVRQKPHSEQELIREADRIICESLEKRACRRIGIRYVLLFSAGFLVGTLLSGILTYISVI